MKIKISHAYTFVSPFILSLYLLSAPSLAAANTTAKQVIKTESDNSGTQHVLKEESTITNEAEYAAYRKRVDGLNQSSSAKRASSSRASSSAKSSRVSAK